MPRYSADHVPQYQHYKRTDKGIVKIAGRTIYLPGPYDSAESRRAYNEELARWFAAGRNAAVLATHKEAQTAPAGVNVEQIVIAFWTHATAYYRDAQGKPTGELENFRNALRTLRRLFGTRPAATFDAPALEACQADMVRHKLARNTINRRIGRIRQVFKFAVRKRLVPATVLVELQSVEGLKMNRSEARETAKVKPVAEAHVHAVMNAANRHIAAMIELQLLTGMRSGEMVIMRTVDIDRSAAVWVYTPTKHKNQHHGHQRVVPLGPKAQAIVLPFLKMDQEAYIFSPADAEAERREAAASRRKTPRSCGNVAGSNRKAKPRKQPGMRYTTASYSKAVDDICFKLVSIKTIVVQ